MEILLIVGVVALIVFIFWKFKIPKFGCITLITGGVKTGKSMLGVHLAYRKYKSQRLKWHFKKFFCKLLKKPIPEEPLLYSNVKLAGVPFVLLTEESLKREERLAYGSVTYIQEASLLADSMMFKDMELNERLTFFNKLYGHETRGGYLLYDTQTIADNHFAVKRSLSTYFWIHHQVKLPFVCLLYIREMIYNEDGQSVNVNFGDAEESLRCVVVPKSVWKKYDAYCFSALTDDLPVLNKKRYIDKKRSSRKKLKMRDVISFRKFFTLKKRGEKK